MPTRCNTCNGVYDAKLPDGTQYFHHCPPVTLYRVVNADGTQQVVTRANIAGRQIVDEVPAHRPNRRDENIVRGQAGKTRTIIAEGLGASIV